MKNQDLEITNVIELTENQLIETDGGFLWIIVAYAVETTLVAGTIAGLGAAAVAGFQSGYDTANKILN